MRIRFGLIGAPVTAAVLCLCTGCDSTTNEEGLDKTRAANAGEAKTYKSYGEYALEKAEEAKKNLPAPKGKASTTKKP
jgi:hypothetical protein